MSAMNRALRVVKYGLAAPVLARLVRFTPLFDGRNGEPPAAINYAGGGDFAEVGAYQLNMILNRTGVLPDARVLDLGSGIGRLAMAWQRSGPKLQYDGLEIVRYGVEWCRKALKQNENFKFHHADLHNSFYNPFGRIAPQEFRFPFGDDHFDLVFATSVFSHLMPVTAQHYLTECARVLRPGGQVYFTYFRERDPAPKGAVFAFAARHDGARVESAAEPELAVAYPMDALNRWAESAGLTIEHSWDGNWTGAAGDDFQDAVLLRKPAKKDRT